MLKEIAITPHAWINEAFTSPEHGHLALSTLWKGVDRGGVIRNLRDGEWQRVLQALEGQWHVRAKEVIKHLIMNGRFQHVPSASSVPPADEQDWVREAYESQAKLPGLSDILSTDKIALELRKECTPLLKGVSKLPFSELFSMGGCSKTLAVTTKAYLDALDAVFRYGNAIEFIDPYFDPEARNYAEFPELLQAIAKSNSTARVVLHRSLKDSTNAAPLTPKQWVDRIKQSLRLDHRLASLKIDICVWDVFHDRYLASNLIGLSLPHGFGAANHPTDTTRWTLLSSVDRDDLLQEFSGSDPKMRRKLLVRESI